uniref:Uncharacterized protein n=2 Tax=Graphocephala atropunctata TaxID=36148 RepID=A0A1B6M8H6_9HEMI
MEFKILECAEPTLNWFCKELKLQARGNLVSIEDSRQKRRRSIVMGKFVKVIGSCPTRKEIVLIAKEVLPNCKYGQKYKVAVKRELALALMQFSPARGDRLAFYEPYIYPNPCFDDKRIKTGKKPPKYLCEVGRETQKCVMWAAKKQGPSDE